MERLWRRRGTILAIVIIAAVLGGTETPAAIGEGDWEVGAYLLNSNFSNSSGLKDVITLGLREAYFFNARNGLEFEVDKGSSQSREDADVSIDVTKIGLSFAHNRVLKTNEKIVPVIRAGVGWIHLDDGLAGATRTFLGGGAGFRYFYTPRFAFRLDGRIYRWRGDGTVSDRSPYFSFDLTLGVSFLLGSAK